MVSGWQCVDSVAGRHLAALRGGWAPSSSKEVDAAGTGADIHRRHWGYSADTPADGLSEDQVSPTER